MKTLRQHLAHQATPKKSPAHPPGMIAVPAVAWLWTKFVQAYERLGIPDGTVCALEDGRCTIAAKRNHMVRRFLEKKHLQWYLCLDSDMTPPPHTILRLLATGRDVVTAVCCEKEPPFEVCAGHGKSGGWTRLNEFGGPDPVKEVDWTGMGCLLVRRNVLEAIGDPWFEADPEGVGEDIAFCEKVRRAGFKIYCDTGLWVGHIAATPAVLGDRITWEPLKPERENLKRACGC